MSISEYFDGPSGYVYLMATPALPGWVKIGFTGDPEQRRARLSTAVPWPYVIEGLWITDSHKKAEQMLHYFMEALRVESGAEFFRVDRTIIIEEDEHGNTVNLSDSIENLIDYLGHVLTWHDFRSYEVRYKRSPELEAMYRVERRMVWSNGF